MEQQLMTNPGKIHLALSGPEAVAKLQDRVLNSLPRLRQQPHLVQAALFA